MKDQGLQEFPPLEEDLGMINTKKIVEFYAEYGVGTKVMGASFRHKG